MILWHTSRRIGHKSFAQSCKPWAGAASQKGDLNGDNTLASADAVIALKIAVGSRPCDAAPFAAADVNNDEYVTSLDALIIMRVAAGAISP